MIISREVDINVNRYGLRVVIPVVQYDSGRQIIFNIVDAELPSGCTSNIFIRKPSGKSVYNSCTVSGNKVTVTLTNQSLSEYGFNDAQIQIIKGEEVVTSFSFVLEVKRSDADNAVISRSESSFFQGLVGKAQAAAKTCTDVLNSIPDDYSKLSSDVNTNTAAIATLNSSSGVQTLTLSEATAGGNASFYYKIGHVVTVFIDCTPSAGGTAVPVATLPSGYRPPVAIRSALTPVVRDSTLINMGTAFGVIDPQGRIQFYMASARRIFFTLTYSVV